ncbi:MAG: STAS domain-containing protein [Hyphomicrobiaceae bacterium]
MKPKKPKPKRLKLPESLNLNAAAPLAQSLRALRGSPLVVEARHVRSVGAQCIQVLLSAVGTWKADNVAFEITAPSPAMIESLQLLGIAPSELTMKDMPQ